MGGASEVKTTVRALGTCRIFNPLRQAQQRGDVKLDQARNYGFVHTSREVLQQLRFVCGQFQIKDEFLPLLARPKLSPDWRTEGVNKADYHILEISSLKDVRIGNISLQLNYFGRYFGEFFADIERARRFWSLSKLSHGQANSQLKDWLLSLPSFQALSESDQGLLASVHMVVMTKADIENDLLEISKLVPVDRTIIMSHVDADRPSGTPIASRGQMIEWLEEIAPRLGFGFYNPTPLMKQVGQVLAMQKNGLDLTHYTPTFADAIFYDIAGKHFGIERSHADPADYEAVAKLDAARTLLTDGDIQGAARITFELKRAGFQSLQLSLLLANIASELGDFESVLTYLDAIDEHRGLTDEANILLMQAYDCLGDTENALETAEALLSDEVESELILETAARASEELGKTERASGLWRLLHSRGVEAASEALLRIDAESETSRQLAIDALHHYPKTSIKLGTLWSFFCKRGDIENGRLILRHLKCVSDKCFGEMTVVARARPRFLAELMRHGEHVGFADKSQVLSLELDFKRQRETALKNQDWAEALIVTSALNTLKSDAASRALLGDLCSSLRQSAKAAYKEGRFDDVIKVADAFVEAEVHLSRMNYLAGRAAAQDNKPALAIDYLKISVSETPDDMAVRRWLARVYLVNGEEEKALDEYRIIKNHNGSTDALRKDAESAPVKYRTRLIRRARDLNARGHVKAAIIAINKLISDLGADDKLKGEKRKFIKGLVTSLRLIGLEDSDEVQTVAKLILHFEPNETAAHKVLGLLAMRERRYEDAILHWKKLDELQPNTTSVRLQLKKTQKLIDQLMTVN